MANSILLEKSFAGDALWLSEPFDNPRRWLDILLRFNHEDGVYGYWGRNVPVDRGSVALVHRMTAKRWSCTELQVQQFIDICCIVGMATKQEYKGCTVVSVVGFEKYIPEAS
tara:strand:+ start:542 stop:877 length:336 start_codon:yes stop_codon:yes gene_type:complete